MSNTPYIGFTGGVFDLFHVGHLNILRNAKSMCDRLIVGVRTDEYVMEKKGHSPVIPFLERMDIVRSCRFVDAVVPHYESNKAAEWSYYKFDVVFVGDDWKGSERWKSDEQELAKLGVKVVYIPYTRTTSSTKIAAILDDRLKLRVA